MSDSVAVPVEETRDLALRFGMAELIARVENRLEPFDGLAEPYDLRDMERDRAALRSEAKDLNTRRIAAEKAYTEDFVREIKTPVRTLTDRLEEVAGVLDGWVKDAEGIAKAKKRGHLVDYWQGCAGIMADAVSFEQVEDPKWLNKTVSLDKAYLEIDAIIERIAGDEDTLKSLSLEYADDAMAEYWATLDVSKAIARNKELVDRAERAARMKAQEEALRAEREAAAREAAERAAATPPPAHEPVPEVKPVPEPEPVAVAAPVEPAEREYIITVRCTPETLDMIVDYLDAFGVERSIR